VNQENVALGIFTVLMGGIVVPNVMLNLFFIAFGYEGVPQLELLFKIVQWSELLFFLEIVQHFFTTYKDPENFESVYVLKKIAKNYIVAGSFFLHLMAVFPFAFVLSIDDNQVYRNLLTFKMVRIIRCNSEIIPEDRLLELMSNIYSAQDRDDKIANDRLTININKIVRQVLQTLLITYILGLFWFRFSD
jgi:hypothetical protein